MASKPKTDQAPAPELDLDGGAEATKTTTPEIALAASNEAIEALTEEKTLLIGENANLQALLDKAGKEVTDLQAKLNEMEYGESSKAAKDAQELHNGLRAELNVANDALKVATNENKSLTAENEELKQKETPTIESNLTFGIIEQVASKDKLEVKVIRGAAVNQSTLIDTTIYHRETVEDEFKVKFCTTLEECQVSGMTEKLAGTLSKPKYRFTAAH